MCALHWHMTYKWLSSGQNSPRILESYTLNKTHKNTPVGEPIVSSSRGPTECISSFVDSLSQPIAQKQESCIKETTHFINFIENTPLPVWVILASSTFVHFTLTFCTWAEKVLHYFEHYLKKVMKSVAHRGYVMIAELNVCLTIVSQ